MTPKTRCTGRCYGKNVEQVARNAGAFNEAMREQGIPSCGKHFPGYSAATSDAHYQLPWIDRSREELDLNELAVFRQFVRDVDSMIIATPGIRASSHDPHRPPCRAESLQSCCATNLVSMAWL